jgi:ribosome-interacting GTPase 1
MPANLPPQYLEAGKAVRLMFRLLSEHKGTEKRPSDLKQKMSRPREEAEWGKPGEKRAGLGYRVPTEGAGQVAIVGDWLGERFPMASTSARSGEGLETPRGAAYDLLGVLRV